MSHSARHSSVPSAQEETSSPQEEIKQVSDKATNHSRRDGPSVEVPSMQSTYAETETESQQQQQQPVPAKSTTSSGTPDTSAEKKRSANITTPDVIEEPRREPARTPPPAPAPVPQDEPVPGFIQFYKDPDDDGYGFRSVLDAVTNPQLITRVHGALRTVLFVTFPLYTIALHPNTQMRLGFPAILIAAVVSTSTHRPTVGEQIGMHSWIWRGIIFMLIFGSAVDAWGVATHDGAWYGLLAAGIFGAGLLNNGMVRRFMYLYFFLYMLELRTHQHYFFNVPGNDAAYSAADYFIGSLMGVAANCIPYPLLVRDMVDAILAKIFAGFGKLLFGMITYVWTADVHSAVLFFSDRTPFVSIEAVLVHMTPLLWFANWEPMEFPLRNPIRRYKLTLLRRILALAYAAFSSGRTVAALRQRQADRIAMYKIRCELYQQAHGRDHKAIEDVKRHVTCVPSSTSAPDSDKLRSSETGSAETTGAREAGESIAALRENSRGYVREFGMVLMQTITLLGSTESTPEKLLKHVTFDALREKDTLMRRNLRLEMLQVMKVQSDLVAQHRQREQRAAREEQEEEDDASDAEGSFSAAGDDIHSPFARTRRYRVTRGDASLLLKHRHTIDSAEVFLRINEMFFHLLLGMIAGEIFNFGEQMKDYKPEKSLPRRFFDYYFVEPWFDFWEELWCRLTFARPSDYRTVKDAFRMTCAYLSAVALNIEIWLPENGLYFFGVTPLLGLPVEEESLGVGINRIAGNTMGCALGYLTFHNTQNLAQKLAMTLCLCFILQCCKYHPTYGHAFFYGSIITLAGLATSMITNELLTRLVTSTYTIIAYTICCLFLLPNNCIKICWNYRCKLTKVVSETIDDVALTLRIPIGYTEVKDGTEPIVYPKRNTDAMTMCSQLNMELSLAERLLSMCVKWTPFAAGDLVVRGMAQFPAGPSMLILLSHQRLVANLHLLVFGVQLLHRPRAQPPPASLLRLIQFSLGDFLDDYAGAVRLIGMDHVQSMQQSRTWSYPRLLSRTSQLSRLRVRLHSIMFECYVIIANYSSRGTFGMTPEDFALLRRDNLQNNSGINHSVADEHGHAFSVHADVSFLPSGDGNVVAGANVSMMGGVLHGYGGPPPAAAQVNRRARPTAAEEEENNSSSSNDGDGDAADVIVVRTGEEREKKRRGESPSLADNTFTDRFLLARREEDEVMSAAQTMRTAHTGRYGEDTGATQQQQQQHRSSSSPAAAAGDVNGGGPGSGLYSNANSFARGRPQQYTYRAPLAPSAAEPMDAFPLTIDNAEYEVKKMMEKKQRGEENELQQQKQKQQQQQQPPSQQRGVMAGEPREASVADQLDATRDTRAVDDAGTHEPDYVPIAPSKPNRHLSKLILFPNKGAEPYIPLYTGPAFTFMEDELSVPTDTDFAAVTTILSSCESLMSEFELMAGSLNTVSGYQKQLRESSVATALLDKWSDRIVAYRKDVHDRYHYPPPPPQKRGPINAQDDPFDAWKF